MVEEEVAASEAQSKKAAKKLAAKAEKAAKVRFLRHISSTRFTILILFYFQKAEYKTGEQPQNESVEDAGEDISKGKYGQAPMIQSREKHPERNFVAVRELKGSVGQKPVWVRARIHTSRCKGKQCFLVLRQQSSTVQVIISVNDVVSKQLVKFSGS